MIAHRDRSTISSNSDDGQQAPPVAKPFSYRRCAYVDLRWCRPWPAPRSAACSYRTSPDSDSSSSKNDRDNRGVVAELLRAGGGSVVESVGAAKAFVLTDLSMPGEDGAAFLTWLREQPRDHGGNVPAVAVTAFYGRYPPDHVSGRAAYFRKPLKSTTSCRRSRRS
jgi:CheY-like chemotaxis protein